MRATVEGATRSELGEGPIWQSQSGSLFWIDIDAGLLHRLSPAGQTTRSLGAAAGSVVPRAAGGLLIAFADRLLVEDAAGETVMSVDTTAIAPRHRFNDGACDSSGRYWTGTIATEFGSEPGVFLRLDPDGDLRVMREEVAFSNGIGWSPDESILYLIDSLDWVLLAFPFEVRRGELGVPRRLVEFDEGGGLPDGLAVDADGSIWVARYGGAAIECYSDDGVLRDRVALEARQPTSLAFGSDDLATLWITSARQHLAEPGPADGALLRLRPGATGLPSHTFGG